MYTYNLCDLFFKLKLADKATVQNSTLLLDKFDITRISICANYAQKYTNNDKITLNYSQLYHSDKHYVQRMCPTFFLEIVFIDFISTSNNSIQ